MAQTRELIKTLKKTLKAQGKTYADVAVELGLTEASVKRLFSKQSFSLDRLDRVCNLLDMEIADLVQLMNEQQQRAKLDRLEYYCGLSGVLNSLLLAALWLEWKRSRSWLIIAITCGSIAKAVIEVSLGTSIVTHISWPPYAWSHVAGLMGGLIFIFCASSMLRFTPVNFRSFSPYLLPGTYFCSFSSIHAKVDQNQSEAAKFLSGSPASRLLQFVAIQVCTKSSSRVPPSTESPGWK